MISSRAGTSSGMDSAAASEIAPRMPLQPTTTRSRQPSAVFTPGTNWNAIRTVTTVAAISRPAPTISPRAGSSSASVGNWSPSRMKSSALSVKSRTPQNAMPLRRDVGVEGGRRVPAHDEAGEDGGEDARPVDLLGEDVGGVAGDERQQDAQLDVGEPR